MVMVWKHHVSFEFRLFALLEYCNSKGDLKSGVLTGSCLRPTNYPLPITNNQIIGGGLCRYSLPLRGYSVSKTISSDFVKMSDSQ